MPNDMRLRRPVHESATNRSIHRIDSARNDWCMDGYTAYETLRGGGQAVGVRRGCFTVQALPNSKNYS